MRVVKALPISRHNVCETFLAIRPNGSRFARLLNAVQRRMQLKRVRQSFTKG